MVREWFVRHVVVATLLFAALAMGCTVEVEPSIGDSGADAPASDQGRQCSDPSDCSSGFCVRGVCCQTECTETCKACNLAGSMGACRPVPDGTVCQAGACDGSSVVGAKVCEAGACKPGPVMLCAPFSCDPATKQCFTACSSTDQCDGSPCASGTCRKKSLGTVCKSSAECDSGSCADGVCCNLACTGACVSCDQPGKMGECRPVAEGASDPHGICKTEAADTCGSSGLCNGQGGCSKYAPGTVCRPSSCSGGSMIPASTCNGIGTCLLGSAINCFPYACADNACKSTCATASDCVAPNNCTNPGPIGSCGKKGLGQKCSLRSECKSTNCVDGVCCDQACTGPCSYCALPNAPGRCTPVPSGVPDPRKACINRGAAMCSTNGKCNGARACQLYPSGTVCRTGTCDSGINRVTDDGVCRDGACRSPAPTTCAPYRCSGARCGSSCSADAQCSGSTVCVDGSCGKKPVGAVCARGSECASTFCAQGICCGTACTSSCFSCSLPGTTGSCTPVPANGVDPAGACRDQGAASCGNEGTCNGTGGCKRYAAGTPCVASRCSAGTFTSEATCDGQGKCTAGSMRACSPFVCNTGGTACFDSCTSNSQCVPTRMCLDGRCGRKENGATCSESDECSSGNCVNGFCCDAACTEVCKTCALPGMRGTCSNIPDDLADDDGGCAASSESSCGNDGKCNGSGACRKWGTSVECRDASCPPEGATLTRAATCDGAGSCPPGDTQSCGNFMCDTNRMCRTTCTSDADCNGKACVVATGICGDKNALGKRCTSNDECASDHCVDRTCCSSASCGACQTCANQAGTCANVPDGMTDPDSCSDSMDPCGTTGRCNGSGSCKFAGASTECGKTCSADGTAVVAKTCDGAGMCTGMGSTKSCHGFLCVLDACASSCEVAGCAPGKVCVNNSCEDPPPPPDGGL